MPSYPESDKLLPSDVTAINQFIEWLEEQDMFICDHDDNQYNCRRTSEDLLYEYLGVNRKKLEAERRQMLEANRKAQLPIDMEKLP